MHQAGHVPVMGTEYRELCGSCGYLGECNISEMQVMIDWVGSWNGY
jgi:hypothetical protein